MTSREAEDWMLKNGGVVNFSPAEPGKPAVVTVIVTGHEFRRPGQGRTMGSAIKDLLLQKRDL